jgi:hypothetical protein
LRSSYFTDGGYKISKCRRRLQDLKMNLLIEKGHDGLALETLVSVSMGLEVSTVFLVRPSSHLQEPDDRKDVAGSDLRDTGEGRPSEHFKGVVRTRHQREQWTLYP